MLSATIGITALNEEANIAQLLVALLDQKLHTVKLEKIIVISDGSTDKTVTIAKSVGDSRIKVIDSKKRLGQAQRQNQIFNLATTDITILLNADVLPADKTCIETLCKPFQNKKFSGMVGAKPIPLQINSTFVSRVIDWSAQWKQSLFEKMAEKNNIYLSHGRARAFSKDLYSILRWPSVTGEDAYSYIFTRLHGFTFKYQPQARIWYTSPRTLGDHISQSERFFYSKTEIAKDENLSPQQKDWYRISPALITTHMLKAIATKPLYAFCYCAIVGTVYLTHKLMPYKKRSVLWKTSDSTKTISA